MGYHRNVDGISGKILTAASAAERTLTRLGGSAGDLAGIRNFVLLGYATPLGNVLHGTPLITALRRTVPGARIHAAAAGFSYEILKNHPEVERTVQTPNPLFSFGPAVSALRAAKFFRGERFAALLVTGNERTPISAAAALAGIHRRVGFVVHAPLAEVPLQFDWSRSQIANNLRIVEALGHGDALAAEVAKDADILEPRIFPSGSDRKSAEDLLRGTGIDLAKPIAVLITQSSPAQRKAWRPERFRAVAEWLHHEYGMQVVLTGTSTEAPAVEAMRSNWTVPNVSVAGKTNLLELAAALSLASIAISLDTGPMHVARAVALPTVVIAPAWQPVIEWLPLNNPRARCLKNADLPKQTDDYIIDEVSVDEVLSAARSLMDAYPPRPRH